MMCDIGRVVLVTGGAKRVGASICRLLHSQGWRVMVHYRSSANYAQMLVCELNKKRPNSASCVQGDLDHLETPTDVINCTIETFGRLDALINNASNYFSTPFLVAGYSDWMNLLGTNLVAPFFMAQRANEFLALNNGAVVNIVDIHSERPLKNFSIYCALKGGLATLTKALAIEMAPKVRVNGVSPGAVLWPEHEELSDGQMEQIVSHTLLKRLGEPDDVARAVAFLLNDAAYISGQIISVDGGRGAVLV